MLEAIDFMEQNKANEEFVDYEGFKDSNRKSKRNLEHMKKELSRDKLLRDRADSKSLVNMTGEEAQTLATSRDESNWFMCEEAEAIYE